MSYSETTADAWLQSVPPEERQCLFEEEVPEVLSAVLHQGWYTQEGCLLACRMRFLHKRCGCYPFVNHARGAAHTHVTHGT